MRIVIDMWQLLNRDLGVIAVVVLFMLWGAVVAMGVLRKHLPRDYGWDEWLSLGVAVGMLPVLVLSTLALLVSSFVSSPWIVRGIAGALAAVVLWLALAPASARPKISAPTAAAAIMLGALGFGLVLLRLSLARSVALPPYFDSAIHYGLIRQLAAMPSTAVAPERLALPLPGFYHLGYHVLLAGIVNLLHLNIARLMLIAGQLVVAMVPLAMYGPVVRATASRPAGFLAVVIVALGWYMPAHAVNWGKYPALFGLLPLLAAINLGCLAVGPEMPPPSRRLLLAAAAIFAVTAAAMQTRLSIVLLLACLAWILSGRWAAFAVPRRLMILGGLLLSIAALIGVTYQDVALRQLWDPFVANGGWLTAVVGLLALLGLRSPSRMVFSALACVCLLLACTLIPLPIAAAGPLLDRPLVSMLLPFPLAGLAALGLANLSSRVPARQEYLAPLIGVVAIAAVAVHGLTTQDFAASSCCEVAGSDDIVAIDWLDQRAGASTAVGIALRPLRVAPEAYPPYTAPADAGIWIQPMTGLSTVALPAETDFASDRSLALLCSRRVDYLYLGNSPRSFDSASLLERPLWYRTRLELPAASVFEVIGCQAEAAG